MRREYDFSKARRGSAVPTSPGKTRITIRLDNEVLHWFKNQVHRAGGGSYQRLINQALREHIARHDEPLEETLRRVLREELQLFTEKGLCETSIRDIGAAAGLSNPALYKHYKSKEALAQELFVFCYRWLHSALERVVGGEFETFAAQFADYSSVFFQQFETAPEAVIYLSDNIQHFWSEVRADVAGDTFVAQINRMLTAAIDREEISKDLDLDLTSAIIIGGIQQLSRMWYLGLLDRPATDWAEPFTDRILALAKS